jgi:hypothetical protein
VTSPRRWLLILAFAGGALLAAIGARFLLAPESAARTFGVIGRPTGYDLHYVVGSRDLWLGVMAVVLAACREWRALALWFTLAAFVCFGDAAIAASATGKIPQVAFHLGCGVGSALLGLWLWRVARSDP